MNYIYLIGNGFDLAHGLPTRYEDFLFSILMKSLNEASANFSRSNVYENELVKISDFRWYMPRPGFESASEIYGYIKDKHINFTPKGFFNNILKGYQNRWVDIEYEYFLQLYELFKRLEKKELRRHEVIDKEVKELNSSFRSLKLQLISYLKSTDYSSIRKSPSIKEHFSDTDIKALKVYINFNYTSTLDLYNLTGSELNRIINIHGTLDSPEDEQIFGYGDEMDSIYPKLEELNTIDFLANFKSFGYSLNSNYQKIFGYLNEPYEVRIMGHSCGISDRVLLNSLFENENCQKIRIYYHQKNEKENDYYEKRIEISRHFSSIGKQDSRIKIVPFDECTSLVPSKS